MKVSVILPVYNEEKYIGKCIETLMGQTWEDIEIIVVDDGSVDNTKSEIRISKSETNSKSKIQNPKHCRQIILLEQSHQGPAKARNWGAETARGEILIFADADMYFDENYIQDLVAPIIKGKTKGTFTKNEMVANWENILARCWNYNENWSEKKRVPENLNEGTDFRAILKSEFLRVGGFDDIGYTDTWSLFRKLEYRPSLVEGAICYHHNPDNLAEVYRQTRWVGKNEFKTCTLKRRVFNIIRYNIISSLIIGLFKAIKKQEPRFVFFKIVYDWGIFVSVLKAFLGERKSK